MNKYNTFYKLEDDAGSSYIQDNPYRELDPVYPYHHRYEKSRFPAIGLAKFAPLKKYWPGCTTEQAYENYSELWSRQRGCCAVCGTEPRKLVVDHCHKTGRVRGLLCHSCNTGVIAVLDLDYDKIKSGLKYLNKIS